MVDEEIRRFFINGDASLGQRYMLLTRLGPHLAGISGLQRGLELGDHEMFREHAKSWVRMINEVKNRPMLEDAVYRGWARHLIRSLGAFTTQDPCLVVPAVVDDEDGQLVQRWPSGISLRLTPLLWRAECPECHEVHIFYLLRLRRPFYSRRLEAAWTDLRTGHSFRNSDLMQREFPTPDPIRTVSCRVRTVGK